MERDAIRPLPTAVRSGQPAGPGTGWVGGWGHGPGARAGARPLSCIKNLIKLCASKCSAVIGFAVSTAGRASDLIRPPS